MQTTFSRTLESVRNREIFLLNQIDVVQQSLEDLLAEQELQLLSSLGSSHSSHSIGCVSRGKG